MTHNKIAFTGRKGSGKDEAAKVLVKHGYQIVKFADPLKDMLRTLLRYRGLGETSIERMIEGDLKEVLSPFLQGKTPRYAMQTLGTEFGRDIIGNDIWIDSCADRCEQFDKVAISDLRFDNENEWCKEAGFYRVRIKRPQTMVNEFSSHPSETAIDRLDVDYTIINDGPLDALHLAIEGLIKYG